MLCGGGGGIVVLLLEVINKYHVENRRLAIPFAHRCRVERFNTLVAVRRPGVVALSFHDGTSFLISLIHYRLNRIIRCNDFRQGLA